jgi:hypothetical protein
MVALAYITVMAVFYQWATETAAPDPTTERLVSTRPAAV